MNKYKKFVETLVEKSSHAERTSIIDGWEVVNTIHGVEREGERYNGGVDALDYEEYFRRVIKKLNSFTKKKSGEYLFRSVGMNFSRVLNIDFSKPQIRVITTLPKGKSTPRAGTGKVLVEGAEYEEIEVE